MDIESGQLSCATRSRILNQLSIIFIITLLMIFSIVTAVIFIIKHNRNTKGKYQLYWTTQKNLFSIKVNKGQFLVKADNLELAKKVGVKALQEKYKNKEEDYETNNLYNIWNVAYRIGCGVRWHILRLYASYRLG